MPKDPLKNLPYLPLDSFSLRITLSYEKAYLFVVPVMPVIPDSIW